MAVLTLTFGFERRGVRALHLLKFITWLPVQCETSYGFFYFKFLVELSFCLCVTDMFLHLAWMSLNKQTSSCGEYSEIIAQCGIQLPLVNPITFDFLWCVRLALKLLGRLSEPVV